MNVSEYAYQDWTIRVFYLNPCMGLTGVAANGNQRIHVGSGFESADHVLLYIKRKIDKGGPFRVMT